MEVKDLAQELHNRCREEGYVCAGIMVKETSKDESHVIIPMCGKSVEILAAICTLIIKYADASGLSRSSVLMDIVGALSEEE